MNWMNQWIKEVMRDIPDGGYRTRAEAELRDHLETEYRALTENGLTEDEARAEVLSAMGEPGKLREEYETAWRNTLECKAFGAVGWFGVSIVSGLISFAAFGLTYSVIIVVSTFAGIYEWDNGVYRLLSGTLVYLAPHIVEAALLRELLSRYRHRSAAITVGLLSNWGLGLCFLINLSAVNARVNLPVGPELFLWWLNRLPDRNCPWITPPYLVLCVLGCILLGQIFGQPTVDKRKPQAV